jgi:hypothetical protein
MMHATMVKRTWSGSYYRAVSSPATQEEIMKPSVLIFLRVVLVLSVMQATAQGPLTPPGPPGPTMKTLAQIEPRTAITNTGAVTISTPGSYYLTANISITAGNAITITADNVTLDLNGFTVSSIEAAATGTGILLSGARRHIHILNGHIKGNVTQSGGNYSGSGFGSGIAFSGPSPANVRVSGVSVSGCRLEGIYLARTSTVVESCTVDTVGGAGIIATVVSSSNARDCGSLGISAITADNCQGFSFGNAGISATTANNCVGSSSGSPGVSAVTANNCSGSSTNDAGVYATTANNCSGSSASGDGLYAETAFNCRGTSTSGAGVLAITANNCVGFSASGDGVSAETALGCRGISAVGHGLDVTTATSCFGLTQSAAAVGLKVFGTANVCFGANTAGGTAIQASIGIGCTTSLGTTAIGNKFLGTP